MGYGRARFLVLTLLLSFFILPSPFVYAEPSDLVGPLTGQSSFGQWTAYEFPVKAGSVYTIRLEPEAGDADVWLYVDGQRAAVGTKTGQAAEELQLKPQQDGKATAWVTGFGEQVVYKLNVRQGMPVASGDTAALDGRVQSLASARGAQNQKVAESSVQKALAQGKIGLQVGHWKYREAMAPFNTQPGSSGGGKTESEVNLAIAEDTASLLRELGYTVDLLPTAFPSGYRADVVVAIHADGGPASRRGFFADRPAVTSLAKTEDRLVQLLNTVYAETTGLPYQYRGTDGTRYYYGYYRVTKDTPMALIETGFLTNATDREVIVGDPLRAARGIAQAIDQFLRERS